MLSERDSIFLTGVCGLSNFTGNSSLGLVLPLFERKLRSEPMLRSDPSRRLRREGLSLTGEKSSVCDTPNSSNPWIMHWVGVHGPLTGASELGAISFGIQLTQSGSTPKKTGHSRKNRDPRDSSWSGRRGV